MRKLYQPDFDQMLKVLRREKPSRPVLFELFMNQTVYGLLAGRGPEDDSQLAAFKLLIDGFRAGGYDYASVHGSEYGFASGERHREKTISLNDGYVITGWAGFESYKWMDPDKCDYSRLEQLNAYLPDGMKLMAMGPGGVLENVIALTGYDNLCLMLYDDPDLAKAIFDKVGSGLLRYYELAVEYDSVGMLMSNDDWGFKGQTFLSPNDMRKYVFPWHKKIVETGHKHNKPVLLHSCGNAGAIYEDIIEDMGYDGKHSFEDVIQPVEECYKQLRGRIAIMGGIDVDFLIRSSVGEIQKRCNDMLDMAEEFGGYAMGSGNSIPEYIPYDKYRAMIDTALDRRVN